jgi:cob(I)alamin adenosyltransferase
MVLTGRNMPQSIRDLAALVTVMQKEKHPFDLGIQAREGIEY